MTPRPTLKASTSCLLCLGLILLAACVYWPARRCAFVDYDDEAYVTRNMHVRTGLTPANVLWAFESLEHANWHPLTWLSLQLDASLYGLNPAGFHLTNVALHALNAALLFWVLMRMTGRPWPSWLAAAVFAVHPLHVQSVAWVAERKDVLSTLFWLTTILTYIRFCERRSLGRYAVVVLSLAASLLSKPMAVTLPCVLLLLDIWPLRRMTGDSETWRAPVIEKTPLVALVILYSMAIFAAQEAGGAVRSTEHYPWPGRLAASVVGYATYLRQFVWPQPLVPLAPYVQRTWGEPAVWLSTAVLIAISVVVLQQRSRRPYLAIGWLWYLGTLVPVIGLVTIGEHAHADRYTYVPLMGIDMALALLIADSVAERSRGMNAGVSIGAAVLLIGLSVATRRQIEVWRTTESLWTHAINCGADSATARCGLAEGQRETGQFDLAIINFRRAMKLRPAFLRAQTHLIWTFIQQNRLDEAEREYAKIIATSTMSLDEHFEMGLKAEQSGYHALAMGAYVHILSVDPKSARARLELALALSRRDSFDAALREFAIVEVEDPALLNPPHVQEELVKARREKTAER